jgi:signal transduction histidine kinase
MMAFVAVILLDAEKARADLQLAHEQLQAYAATAEELAVAEERNRLARDLHDSVTQALYSQTLYAEAAARELAAGETETTADHLTELGKTARLALQEMRLMIFELRSPVLEKQGLVAALQERLEAVEARAGIRAGLKSTLMDRLPTELEVGLYGIAREALNNVLKHARATEVQVSISQTEQKVLMEVMDNGIGFETGAPSNVGRLGVKGMRERASQLGADLRLESRPEGGTTVRVEAPNG